MIFCTRERYFEVGKIAESITIQGFGELKNFMIAVFTLVRYISDRALLAQKR